MRASDQPAAGDLPEESPRVNPDPLLSASLYASGAVDEAITGWIVPLWSRLRSLGDTSERFLWLWRHARHGEHLKLRIHAGPSDRALLSEAIEETARRFLAELGPRDPSSTRRSAPWPPVDADEDVKPLPEDRSFRFTRYLRQAPILGNPLLQDDDEYAARFCRCLGQAHHWLLDEIESAGWDRELPARWFTIFLATAIDAAGISPGACLQTYRDWLIRLPLLKKKATQQHADAWTEKIRQRSAVWDGGGFEALPIALAEHPETLRMGWQEALRALFDYARSQATSPAFERDPFASSVLDLPLGKVLLALANSLGVPMFDQAVLAHRLLASTDPEAAGANICLQPPSAVDQAR